VKRLVLMIALVSLIVSCETTKRQTPTKQPLLAQKLESFIQDYMDWYGLPGLSIAVVQDGRVVFAKGYGVTSLETVAPVTPRTIFSMASVTKLFVGTAVMQLAERGLVELDAPIVRYLPYFRLADERYREITVKQMLSHTSGMPDMEGAELYSSWENPEFDELALERYVRNLAVISLLASPGESYNYSNMAYDVLGDMVAKVSGEAFEEYVRKNILIPLGMKDSTLLYEEVNKELLAQPHLMGSNLEYAVSDLFPYSRRHPACGSLFSNVMDMSRWAMANIGRGTLEGKRILDAASYDIMWEPAVKADNPVGISWLIEDIGPFRMLSHGGGDPGFRTEFYIVPDRSIGVVVMANAWEDQINPVAMRAINILLERDDPDWFTFFHGCLWKSIRKDGVDATLGLCRQLIGQHGKELFHPAILNQHGRRLDELGKLEDAAKLFELNVELYPDIQQLRDVLAETYRRLGKSDLAIDSYRRSLELNPAPPEK